MILPPRALETICGHPNEGSTIQQGILANCSLAHACDHDDFHVVMVLVQLEAHAMSSKEQWIMLTCTF